MSNVNYSGQRFCPQPNQVASHTECKRYKSDPNADHYKWTRFLSRTSEPFIRYLNLQNNGHWRPWSSVKPAFSEFLTGSWDEGVTCRALKTMSGWRGARDAVLFTCFVMVSFNSEKSVGGVMVCVPTYCTELKASVLRPRSWKRFWSTMSAGTVVSVNKSQTVCRLNWTCASVTVTPTGLRLNCVGNNVVYV